MADIIFILDESSSMYPYSSYYIEGINSLLYTQKIQNPSSRFTMIKFNTNVNVLCNDVKIDTLPEFTGEHYKPSGLTALYDAIGTGMILGHTNKVKNVIMFILTDGEDNYSSNFTHEQIKERVKYLSSIGWSFVYIAANQDAQDVGEKLGIDTCLTYNQTKKSIEQVVDSCNIAIGHIMHRWTGIENQYSQQEMPTDVRELTDILNNFNI